MPPRDWKLRIADILEAIAKVHRYVDGMTFEDFAADEKTIDAVIRNFAVIGEAAARMPSEVTDVNPHVPWTVMRSVRNIVVHVYFGVDLRILWDTIHVDLPPLVDPLGAML